SGGYHRAWRYRVCGPETQKSAERDGHNRAGYARPGRASAYPAACAGGAAWWARRSMTSPRAVPLAERNSMVQLRPQPLKGLNDDAEPAARTPPAKRVRAWGRKRPPQSAPSVYAFDRSIEKRSLVAETR